MTHSFQPTETDDQLQQELRSLFVVDTQNYLQRYSQIAQHLEAGSWRHDIQELYRCVHTIKGGAVTVAATAILSVATALEDLFTDLRYLEQSPPLVDGHLNQALLEAGELLTGSLELQTVEATEPILKRIQTLHQEIRERYLSQWNEQKQLHQEFAEQGFDLVVLELEIALERLPLQGTVPPALLNIAQQTLAQLQQIGQELKFASGWTTLLDQSQTILARSENAIWRSHWLQLFQALKACAKQGGNAVSFEFAAIDLPASNSFTETNAFDLQEFLTDDYQVFDSEVYENIGTRTDIYSDIYSDIETVEINSEFEDSDDIKISSEVSIEAVEIGSDINTDIGSFLDDLQSIEASSISSTPGLDNFFAALPAITLPEELSEELLEELSEELPEESDRPSFLPDFSQIDHTSNSVDLGDVQAWLEPPLPTDNFVVDLSNVSSQLAPQPAPVNSTQSRQALTEHNSEQVRIPVPLEKLDRSSQHLVETLLALRTTQGFYQTLQNQITQLVALAQEGVQYVTHLRQIQDDYALLNDLRGDMQASASGPTPERYRQGYTVINRLLETSLRLSEIGAETGKTAQQITENLRTVDTSVLKLQNTVEDSRLIPFQNLTFRARAILRDLVTRYGKPARLTAQGEKTELDISTARNLEPALLHLIRNAYDHGLEAPDDRAAQGKPEQGTITLSLQRRGNTFQLELTDDGCGIDPAKIQSRAESLGLPLTDTQTPIDLLAVICQPGFTSETQANEISGRGVGMDVVAAQATRLGGRLSLHTVSGAGTTFCLQFPVPRLLVPCMLLQAGDHTFAIPLEDIRTTTLLDTLNATRLKDFGQNYSWVIESETGTTPALDLLEYWQPRFAGRALADTAICVHVHPPDFQQGIWLLADDLLEQSELIITPLPTPLSAPDGLIGLSLQSNGALVPVLEARALAERLLIRPIEPLDAAAVEPPEFDRWQPDPSTQTILIVDDAALMRRRLEASLNNYGYTTHTCADGREAWNWLQQHPHPRLIVTDIEMPNMDGFTLVDRCRQMGITVPILVISSRLSEEWSDEARRLGASDYLTKGFSTNELLAKVSALLDSLG